MWALPTMREHPRLRPLPPSRRGTSTNQISRASSPPPPPHSALELYNAASSQRGFSHTPATVRLARAWLLRGATAVLRRITTDVLRRIATEPCRFQESQFPPLVRLLLPDHELTLLRFLPALLRTSRVSHKALVVCLDCIVSSSSCHGALDKLLSDLRDPQNMYLPRPNTCVYNILIKPTQASPALDLPLPVPIPNVPDATNTTSMPTTSASDIAGLDAHDHGHQSSSLRLGIIPRSSDGCYTE